MRHGKARRKKNEVREIKEEEMRWSKVWKEGRKVKGKKVKEGSREGNEGGGKEEERCKVWREETGEEEGQERKKRREERKERR